MHAITVRHNFETAHRLPHLPGKCRSLHGHSWWVEVTYRATALPDSQVIVDFGAVKHFLRAWIDRHLDHGVMLGKGDPLVPLLADQGKVFVMPGWPTVEAVAELLAEVGRHVLFDIPNTEGVQVARVTVAETHTNQASWERPAALTPERRP